MYIEYAYCFVSFILSTCIKHTTKIRFCMHTYTIVYGCLYSCASYRCVSYTIHNMCLFDWLKPCTSAVWSHHHNRTHFIHQALLVSHITSVELKQRVPVSCFLYTSAVWNHRIHRTHVVSPSSSFFWFCFYYFNGIKIQCHWNLIVWSRCAAVCGFWVFNDIGFNLWFCGFLNEMWPFRIISNWSETPL